MWNFIKILLLLVNKNIYYSCCMVQCVDFYATISCSRYATPAFHVCFAVFVVCFYFHVWLFFLYVLAICGWLHFLYVLAIFSGFEHFFYHQKFFNNANCEEKSELRTVSEARTREPVHVFNICWWYMLLMI